jgi:hypothetical protein
LIYLLLLIEKVLTTGSGRGCGSSSSCGGGGGGCSGSGCGGACAIETALTFGFTDWPKPKVCCDCAILGAGEVDR